MAKNTARQFIPMKNKFDRVILLIDLDCFYCQVEEKLDPSLRNKPVAVVQYNAWQGGGIIAVNYAARAKGVQRHMRGEEALQKCPEIQLVKVPNVDDKADLNRYREAGAEVANVLQQYTKLFERASVDEAYLDITESVDEQVQKLNSGLLQLQVNDLINTYVEGYTDTAAYCIQTSERLSNWMINGIDETVYDTDEENYWMDHDVTNTHHWLDIKLLIGASIASQIRYAVKTATGYECSAGIAHNKILAKLACGRNKPNKQTVMPLHQIRKFFATLPVDKVKGLGGKFGEELCQRLKVRFMGDLLQFSEQELQKSFNAKTSNWLYNICRGIDLETVIDRCTAKSVCCSKKFPGPTRICLLETLKHWLIKLATEVCGRLERDESTSQRRAKQICINFAQDIGGVETVLQRSAPLSGYDPLVISQICLQLIRANTVKFLFDNSGNRLNNAITFLGITAGKFSNITPEQKTVQSMFAELVSKEKCSNKESYNEPVADGNMSLKCVEPIAKDKATISVLKPPATSKRRADTENNLLDSFVIRPTKKKLLSDDIENSENMDINDEQSKQEIQLEVQKEEQPEKVSLADYTCTYAEYDVPDCDNVDMLLNIICDKCQVNVPNDPISIQTHQDFHYAQELRQMQFEEYQSEIRAKNETKLSTPNAVNKSLKKTNTQQKKKTKGIQSIQKFLKRLPSNSSIGNKDTVTCEKCLAAINTDTIQEHLDAHLAKELQADLNQTAAVHCLDEVQKVVAQ